MGGLAKAARRKLRKRAAGMEVRRKREFTYRGYTLDEIKAMTLQEVIELLPSRARRTYLRGLDEQQATFVERLRAAAWDETALRTHCRDVPILPDFIGKKVSIHNGKAFETVEIKPEMIGHYLGEFAMTRRPVKHSGPGVGATRSSKFMPLK
ncbi:MAG: 30S ribosomal protein S19 [Methanobacteriota archaeon]|nr:MAG: 30S ribosomal protein S19 [Euryarchaeota archaeon]